MAHVGCFSHFVFVFFFVFVLLFVFVFAFVFVIFITGHQWIVPVLIIIDILKSYHFQKYGTCWVF